MLLNSLMAAHRKNDCSHRSVHCPTCNVKLQYRQLEAHLHTNFVHHFTALSQHCTLLRRQVADMLEVQREMQSELDSLRQHISASIASSSIVEEIRAVREQLDNNEVNPDECARIIVALMRKHTLSSWVQAVCCYQLACWIDKSGPPGQAAVVDAGGVECIVAAMQQHWSEMSVQETACEALASLSGHPSAAARLAAVDGIESVVSAMQEYGGRVALQESACHVLHSVARDAGNRARIVAAGGIECIVAAMKRHTAGDTLQKWASAALSLLADNAHCRARLDAAGGSELIASELQKQDTVVRLKGRG